jgi:hypothetical protein
MAMLVRAVPTYVLELGTAVDSIPDALVSLLEELG